MTVWGAKLLVNRNTVSSFALSSIGMLLMGGWASIEIAQNYPQVGHPRLLLFAYTGRAFSLILSYCQAENHSKNCGQANTKWQTRTARRNATNCMAAGANGLLLYERRSYRCTLDHAAKKRRVLRLYARYDVGQLTSKLSAYRTRW